MSNPSTPDDFRTILSIDPLLEFWRRQVAPMCPHMAEMFDIFEKRVLETPELLGDIEQPDLAAQHTDILAPLMSVAFPQSTWDTEISAAFTPFQYQTIYCTPAYQRLLFDNSGQIAGRLKGQNNTLDYQRFVRAYGLILKRLYGIDQGVDSPLIRIVTDPETGLERHFQITPDFQFVQVGTVGKPIALTDQERERVIEHIANPEVLTELLPPSNFVFRGFTVVRAVDVTESEITSALERDLIDQESIFSADGFGRLQSRLRTLFGQPELKASLAAVQGDKVLILNDGHTSTANCLFTNSSHIPLSDLKHSVWLQAIDHKKILRIPDLSKEPNLCPAEQEAVDHGVRAMLIAPLFFGGEAIGTFWVKSNQTNCLNAVDAEKMRHIAPLFSMALKRGLDDMNNEVQAVIKEKCTAVHPSVEWRFRIAAVDHMERLRQGKSSEMEPIIFKGVIPLFGQSDIRGSSEARIQSIQADLTEQLTLAGNIMRRAGEAKSWPLIDEFAYRIDQRVAQINTGLSTEEESAVASFLQQEVESSFDELRSIGPGVSHAIDAYNQAIDPLTGVIYRKRKAFEESVSMLNERLSAYLDRQQAEAQQAFPHYFEKHQTDGIDYVIYLGASMHPEGKHNAFYLNNLSLWQFMVACGLAWHTRQVQPELKVPLDTCHLILVNHSPLSIRFRYDEKRFDVDGAYDVRHEIIKSRLDKAVVKGGSERLTQPGKIAVVYSHPKEGLGIQRHINYLQSRGHVLADLETIDLEDLPGVRGLKALRVSVNLEAEAAIQRRHHMTG
jgi:hypothetical protein